MLSNFIDNKHFVRVIYFFDWFIAVYLFTK